LQLRIGLLLCLASRVREQTIAHQRVEADLARLTDAVIDAHADGDDGRAAKAGCERDETQNVTLREAGERLEGAKRAVARAEVERATFAAENVERLIAERRPDALQAVEEVEAAVARLTEAHGRWHAVAGEITALLRLAGRDSRWMPSFPAELEQLVRDARRAGGVSVPAPVAG
jgi:hypothetical protein